MAPIRSTTARTRADCRAMGMQAQRFGLGVDTGGTYTDAVVYDRFNGRLVAKAKAATTPDDLAVGITEAIDRALGEGATTRFVEPAAIDMVALSTTLATNALVEGIGRPACLVTIGFQESALDRGGLRQALGDDEVIVVAGGHNSNGDEIGPLDLDSLAAGVDAVADHVDGFAVTAHFATRNPDHEVAARDLIRQRTGKPVTCSHHLSARLNGPRRALTALLNARLIPMIEELVTTTAAILGERGVAAPMMMVRGNGSLVSVDFVRDRPVETILSGPAASLIGAAHLAGTHDSIIADIGGTTTDIAVLRDGRPELNADGALVGGHQTMVEAVMMQTHGLGGDSGVELADRAVGAQLVIGPRRVIPLSLLASTKSDVVLTVLRRQIAGEIEGPHDGRLVRLSKRADGARLDRSEQQVVDAIGDGWVAVDSVASSSLQVRALGRLVSRALIRLAAFTPTDASHVLGTQTTFDPEAARLGALLLARSRDRYGAAIAGSPEEISSVVVETFARRSAEAILGAALDRDGLPTEAARSDLVAAALDGAAVSSRLDIGLAVPLIGLGAPASTYYPAVGALLGADVEIPGNADVANAIGAVVGKVRVQKEITVTAPRRGVYRIHGRSDPETLWEQPHARDRALELASEAAAAAVVEAGAADFSIEVGWSEKIIDVQGRPMFVEGVATATASGYPKLD